MPDPTLKTAAAEIEAILKKYDAAGVILLCSPTHVEYLYSLSPSWSCARLESIDGRAAVRIRAKREDFPSEREHKKALELTTSMMLGFHSQLERSVGWMQELIEVLGIHFDVSHWEREEN